MLFRSVGTASERNHDYLRSLGAIPVTYGDGLADRVRTAAPQGVDAVFDAAGHDTLAVSVELMGGATERIVTIAATDAEEHGVLFSAVTTTPEEVRAGLTEHARLAVEGRLAVRLDQVLPLAHAAKAQELSETGHAQGKIVIRL